MCGICDEKEKKNRATKLKKMAAKKTNQGQNGPDDRKAVGIPGGPLMTDAQRATIKARADGVKAVADELKKKYSPQGLEITPGTGGMLKVTAQFMRGHCLYTLMKQLPAERLADVAAILDQAIAFKPQKK